jgi:Cu+-exporting ATPase
MTSELTLHISGMICASCANRVEKALRATTGVESAEIDLANKSAHVRMSESTSATHLIVALSAAGYEATLSTLS